jgi:hypothetical protein
MMAATVLLSGCASDGGEEPGDEVPDLTLGRPCTIELNDCGPGEVCAEFYGGPGCYPDDAVTPGCTCTTRTYGQWEVDICVDPAWCEWEANR